MLMNLVGPRFTSPPTTQVKANNSQRSGNGLSEVEKAIVREMKLLKASTESIGQSIQNSLAKGGNPSELRIQLATQLDKLNELISMNPELANNTFPITGKPLTKRPDSFPFPQAPKGLSRITADELYPKQDIAEFL